MAKKHLSTEEFNKLHASLKDGETKHWPEYDLMISKPKIPLPTERTIIDPDREERVKHTKMLLSEQAKQDREDSKTLHQRYSGHSKSLRRK